MVEGAVGEGDVRRSDDSSNPDAKNDGHPHEPYDAEHGGDNVQNLGQRRLVWLADGAAGEPPHREDEPSDDEESDRSGLNTQR